MPSSKMLFVFSHFTSLPCLSRKIGNSNVKTLPEEKRTLAVVSYQTEGERTGLDLAPICYKKRCESMGEYGNSDSTRQSGEIFVTETKVQMVAFFVWFVLCMRSRESSLIRISLPPDAAQALKWPQKRQSDLVLATVSHSLRMMLKMKRI